MSHLQAFADRLHKKTGGNFFIDITYNPGRRSHTVNLDEIFVAMPRLQMLSRHGVVTNLRFSFKYMKDVRDESESVYGRGQTPDQALAKLLQFMAGKTLVIALDRNMHTIRVPKNIATKEK